MTELLTVPFSKLIASDAINARAATKDGLDELAASILAKGLIQPLAVRPADAGCYEVIDGRRRFQALAKLVKAKSLNKSHAVPVLVRNEDDGDALETSLMANTVRLPMHPVDQHEVFARLVAQGQSETDIAARFGISDRTVKQHLALGRLAPEVRNAWRKGKIDRETAQAFTLADDVGVQADTLARLTKQGQGRLSQYAVRSELSEKREPAARSDAFTFVGEDAYIAAGGKLSDDLFDDARYIDDVPLLDKLARDKLQAECDRLVADGWAWADARMPHERGDFDRWDCEAVGGEEDERDGDDLTLYTGEEKARSGCIVEISYNGEGFDYSGGLIKPTGIAAADDDDFDAGAPVVDDDNSPGEDTDVADVDDDGDNSPFRISGALAEAITTAQTDAVAVLVRDNFELALRITLAAMLSRDFSSPAKIAVTSQALHAPDKREFAAVWPRIVNMSYGEAMAEFAKVAAGALCLVDQLNVTSPRDGAAALVASLPSDKYLFWMREAFNATDYFKRATKAAALAAIDEIVEAGGGAGLPPEDVRAGMKKADLAGLAAERAKASGWLPPELRSPNYAVATPENAPTVIDENRVGKLVKGLVIASEAAE